MAVKNASRTSIIGNILEKESSAFGNTRIIPAHGASQNLLVEQGKSFLNPTELTQILQENAPAGKTYPFLPPTPPKPPFPSKAYFSPVAQKITNGIFIFNNPGSNILLPDKYSLNFSYPYPIHAPIYNITVFHINGSNVDPGTYSANTDYININVNYSEINYSTPYSIRLYGQNNYGSSTINFSNVYPTFGSLPVFDTNYSILFAGANNLRYSIPALNNASEYYFNVYDSNNTLLNYPLITSQIIENNINLAIINLTSNTVYNIRVNARNNIGTGSFNINALTCNYVTIGASVLDIARQLNAKYTSTTPLTTITAPLLINNRSLSSYDFVKYNGNITFNNTALRNSDLFTNNQDSNSAWVIINGNLTITAGQTIRPPVRKLFTVVYVTGILTIPNTAKISMTARGANHSNIPPQDIYIFSNVFVPANGGDGGVRTILQFGNGSSAVNSGKNSINGGTGGGSTGIAYSQTGRNNNAGASAGSGSTGTSFSGGVGSGGVNNFQTSHISYSCNAPANGGMGTAGVASIGRDVTGGAGNPGGSNFSNTTMQNSGTGGTLIVICARNIIIPNASVFESLGTNTIGSGGPSGGGSITIVSSNILSFVNLSNFVKGGSNISVIQGKRGFGGTGSYRLFRLGTNNI